MTFFIYFLLYDFYLYSVTPATANHTIHCMTMTLTMLLQDPRISRHTRPMVAAPERPAPEQSPLAEWNHGVMQRLQAEELLLANGLTQALYFSEP